MLKTATVPILWRHIADIFNKDRLDLKLLECRTYSSNNDHHFLSDLDSKRLLVSPSTEEYDALVGKIRKLVRAGHGETLYEIGAGGI